MARSRGNNSSRGRSSSSSRRSGKNRDSQQGSGQGRGWHGDPEGHARAAKGEEVRGGGDE